MTKPSRVEDDAAPGRVLVDRLQGAAMIGVLAFGLWQGMSAMTTPAARRQFDGKLDLSAIIAGRTAAAVNAIMAHDLPTDRLWRTIGGVIRWSVFATGGPQVSVGAEDWLYLTEELRPWQDAAANMQARATTVRAVADALAARNIRLVVAVVPDKARIQSATLGHAPRAAQTVPRYGEFAAMLREKGIDIVDLDAVLSRARIEGDLYFRTDTHWNQRGAALAAQTIATRAVAGPATAAGVIAAPAPAATEFTTTRDADTTDGPGDLLRLMSLDAVGDRWAPALRPPPDRQRVEHTAAVPGAADPGGLLDDAPVAPVALIGSSYSLNSNFAGRLEQALHQPVANFAKLGGGFAGSAQAYLTGTTFSETPPSLVIWEIPERVLGQEQVEADRQLAEWAASKH